MNSSSSITERILQIVRERLGDQADQYQYPPPVFVAMKGEFVDLDLKQGTLTTRFPILEEFLNPYHTLQGGIIAAAVDNTLGPLSLVVAPPNVTRKLELTYSQPVTLEMSYIQVIGIFLGESSSRLHFKADVRSMEGERLARAKAVHIVV